jgi:hypothetical protein
MGPALALCVLWIVATYLLEGRPRTLLQPEAPGLRLAYIFVANVTIGTAGAVLVLRRLLATGRLSASAAGTCGSTTGEWDAPGQRRWWRLGSW